MKPTAIRNHSHTTETDNESAGLLSETVVTLEKATTKTETGNAGGPRQSSCKSHTKRQDKKQATEQKAGVKVARGIRHHPPGIGHQNLQKGEEIE